MLFTPPVTPDLGSPTTQAPVSERGMLGTQLDAISAAAQKRYGVTVGTVIWDLETDVLVERDSERAFALGDTSRLAFAFALLQRVDRGDVAYDDVASMLSRSIVDDDDTASDAVVTAAGGIDGVNAALRSAGVTAMLIRKNATALSADMAANRTFASGGDNASSATALALLLSQLARGDQLQAASRGHLIGLMAHTTQLRDGFPAGLPPGTRIAHIPGQTLDGACDAAIAEINGRNVIIVAMLAGGTTTPQQRAAILASVARAAFDSTARLVQ